MKAWLISSKVAFIAITLIVFAGAIYNTAYAEVGTAIQTPAQINAGFAEGNAANAAQVAAETAAKAAAPGATAADKQAALDAAEALKTAQTKSTEAKAAAMTITNSNAGGCNLLNNFDFTNCLLNGLTGFIFSLANLMLGLSGVVLNFVVIKTVFGFSTLIGNAPGLLIAWGIFRDIGNLALLFGFIFIGLSTILGISNYSASKTLPRLLLFAVLLNFSLFVSEAIIDTSNVLASVMYSQADTNTCALTSGTGSNVTDEECLNYGLAGHIMQSTGLSTIFALNEGEEFEASVTIGLAVFAVVGSVVFFTMAILLTIRAVTLTFLMVASPIGFAGMAIPAFRGFAKDWWSRLIKQAFFAPILLLLIFVSLKISDGFSKGGSLPDALIRSNTSTIGVIFVFVIIIAFMLASLKAAQSLGATGSKFAVNWGKKIGYAAPRMLGRMGRATAGAAGTQTLGRSAAAIQKRYQTSNVAKNLAGSKGILGGLVARPLDRAIAGATAGVAGAKFGGKLSFKDDEKRVKARKDELAAARKEANIDERKKALKDELGGELDSDNPDEKKIADILQKMTSTEIQELEQMKKEGASLDLIAKLMSVEKFSSIMKEGNTALTETEKETARVARFKDLTEHIKTIESGSSTPEAKKAAQDAIRKYSSKDLQNVHSEISRNSTLLDTYSGSQREDLIKSDNVSPSLKDELNKRSPVEKVKQVFESNSDKSAAAALITSKDLKMSAKDIAKLPGAILSHPDITDVLSVSALNAIDREGLSDIFRDPMKARLKERSKKPGQDQLKKYLGSNGGIEWV